MSDRLSDDYAQLLAERNAMSMEITRLQMALEPFATLYDTWLEAKDSEWCEQHGAYPLHMLMHGRFDVMFTMPTLENCRKAKVAAEGGDPFNVRGLRSNDSREGKQR